jgi:2,3-bisphosphoglycerate-dependent phosphoglycerate mutase
MPATRVWLIRHGQTDWNTQHRWQGHAPTSLNAMGHEQARALGLYLRDAPIEAVYTSDLPRALQTAQAVAAYHNLEPIVETRFREINVGVFQALFPDELAELYPAELASWRSGDTTYAPPGGESLNQVQQRAMQAFADVVARDNGDHIAIVTHGGTIRQMLKGICSDDPAVAGKIPVPNTSYTLLRRDDDRWRVEQLTVTPHLPQGSTGGNTSQSSL